MCSMHYQSSLKIICIIMRGLHDPEAPTALMSPTTDGGQPATF